MSEHHGKHESKLRAAVIVYFPMLIAVLSLVTSIYNGYLNNRFVTIIQGNVGRVEYLKTCRDIIDAYFQVKFHVDQIKGQPGAASEMQARNAVNRFAALGTYLANLRDEEARREYTALTKQLEGAVARAGSAPANAGVFNEADAMFGKLNDDCIRTAQSVPM
jgi:hypothetical protein